MASETAEGSGFDIDRIDEVIHGRLRLGIMAYLSTAESADFAALKARLQATDGNLSVHLRKLEERSYVAIDKSFVARSRSPPSPSPNPAAPPSSATSTPWRAW